MAVTLVLIGKSPGQTQFGLATFTEHYKTDSTADVVLTDGSVPHQGDAHPSYPNMYVTDRNVTETGESASALDLVYMGLLDGVFPPAQNSSERTIVGATTNTSTVNFPVPATTPLSIQYLAPATTLVVLSNSDTSTAVCPDPPAVVASDLITFNFGPATVPASNFPDILTWIMDNAFVQYVVETGNSQEIVAGRYWQVTKRKVMTMFPYAPPT